MSNSKLVLGLMVGSTLVASGAPVAQALAAGINGNAQQAGDAVEGVAYQASNTSMKTIPNVEGVFDWNQGATASNSYIAKHIYRTSDTLCSSQGTYLESDAVSQTEGTVDEIAITGDVDNAFTANVSEYEKKAPVRKVMGCTCAANPTDGQASANAEVAGFQLTAVLDDAQVQQGVNTITFVCSDGYSVSLPLTYVAQHYSVIVTEMNGESLKDAVGCSNQLWLGNSSALAFARNVVSIELSTQDTPPAIPAPGGNMTPNVGITEGAAEQ